MDLRPLLESATAELAGGGGGAGGGPTFEQAREVAAAVAEGRFDPVQLGALLALWAAQGTVKADTLAGFAAEMGERAVAVTLPPHLAGRAVEIVGTGGDGHDTVNISTASAVLAAGAGVPIAKHGSISVSSKSGSADVLRALGVRMLPPPAIAPCLQAAGIAFMFAPLFHPALAAVVPVRRSLRIRTLFNVLGPLLNPARVSRAVLGVYAPALLPVYADAVARLGHCDHVVIVHCGGLDEFAPVGPASVIELRRDAAAASGGGVVQRREFTVDSAAWGVPTYAIDALRGGTPEENAATITAVLRGDVTTRPAVAHALALNAGACLYVSGQLGPEAGEGSDGLRKGYRRAWHALASGAGGGVLSAWAEACAKLEGEGKAV
jgi:anthranilate phosphoribosyltransferase